MKDKNIIDVVVAGHICLDMTPKFVNERVEKLTDVLTPGKLVNVHGVVVSTGGPVSNTGLALRKLGLKAEFMAKIGDDMLGKVMINILNQYVKQLKGMSIVRGRETSYTIALAIPGIDRMFLHHTGTNDTFGYDDINFNVVKKTKIFHLGYPPLMRNLYINEGDQLVKIFKKVNSLGITTSLDMSLPDMNSESGKVDWNKILKKLLQYVDIFHPSIEEAMFMVNMKRYTEIKKQAQDKDVVSFFTPQDFTNVSDILLSYGTKIITLKCGHCGFYIRTADKSTLNKIGLTKPAALDNWSNRELWCPAYHVDKIVSATGSGDSSIAGFSCAYLRKESIENCIKSGNAAGAQNIRVLDAVSGIKTWKETINMVNDPENKFCELNISSPGWNFDNKEKIWHGPKELT